MGCRCCYKKCKCGCHKSRNTVVAVTSTPCPYIPVEFLPQRPPGEGFLKFRPVRKLGSETRECGVLERYTGGNGKRTRS
uniref:Uncharacterized protein n=1 Tax=Echinococcus granulosus TaxID=6210 RepID=A0A068WB89_ECHGR|nr:hypothetical protein EgrG_000968200 [Echinococcus granulosus]